MFFFCHFFVVIKLFRNFAVEKIEKGLHNH